MSQIDIHAPFLTEEGALALTDAMGADRRFWNDWVAEKLIVPNAQGLYARGEVMALVAAISQPLPGQASMVRRDAMIYDRLHKKESE